MNNISIQEPPAKLKIQKHWRNHNKVTDEMANWLKVNCGCKEYHGIKDLDKTSHHGIFGKKIPKGKVAWMKVDLRPGKMNVFKDNVIYTDKYGRNPVDFDMNAITVQPTQ